MRKFVDPIPNGGAPMFSDTVIRPLFKDIYAVIESILHNVASETEGIILTGCVVTPNGGNYDCSSGIIYLQGQFMDFGGWSNKPLPQYIVPFSPIFTAFTFFDGVSKNLIINQIGKEQNSAPGSGQYISVTNTTPRNLTNYVSPQVAALISSSIGSESSVRSSADTTLQNNINALTAITLTAGNGLSGGGDLSTNRTFDINVDNSTIEIIGDTLNVKDAGIDFIKTAFMFDSGAPGIVTNSSGMPEFILTIPLPNNKTFFIEATMIGTWVSGGGGVGDLGAAKKLQAYKKISGSTNLVGSPIVVGTTTTQSGSPALSFGVSGSSALLTVQCGSGDSYRVRVVATLIGV